MAMEEFEREGQTAEDLGKETKAEGFEEPTEAVAELDGASADPDETGTATAQEDIEAADEAEATFEAALGMRQVPEIPGLAPRTESHPPSAEPTGESVQTESAEDPAQAETDMESAMEEDIAGASSGVARRNPNYQVDAFNISLQPSRSQLRSGMEEADWFQRFRERLHQQHAEATPPPVTTHEEPEDEGAQS